MHWEGVQYFTHSQWKQPRLPFFLDLSGLTTQQLLLDKNILIFIGIYPPKEEGQHASGSVQPGEVSIKKYWDYYGYVFIFGGILNRMRCLSANYVVNILLQKK